jgi:hypothetical protein
MLELAIPDMAQKIPDVDFELKIQQFVELMRVAKSTEDQLDAMRFARAHLQVTAKTSSEQRTRLAVCAQLFCNGVSMAALCAGACAAIACL